MDINMVIPKISVILTVYNTAPYLRQCLDSIIEQTLKDIEIICVDDGSTDSSLKILNEYKEKENRIVIIEQEHAGAGVARNNGLSAAKGEYLSILDSDDFFEKDMLEKAYACAKEQNAEIVVFQSDAYDHNTGNFSPLSNSLRIDTLPENRLFSAEEIADRIFGIGSGWAWDKLFKKDFVDSKEIKFQEIRTSNDLLFVFYLYSRAKRIYAVEQTLVHHRVNAYDSLSVTRDQSWENCYYAAIALKNKLTENGTYNIFRHSFVNWALSFILWNIRTLNSIVRRQVIKKCREEYFEQLDILGHNREYFANESDYDSLQKIMTEEIKVTVVIPVYNGEVFLRSCLESVCTQTLTDIQIICVNDGSTDQTKIILDEYEKRDSRIMVVNKEHSNAGDSRNAGMNYAEGKYLSFLDSDDFFEPNMLEIAYNTAISDDADICLFRSDLFDNLEKSFRDNPWTLKDWIMPKHRPFSAMDCPDIALNMSSCTAWDKLFKREFLEKEQLKFQSVNTYNDMFFTLSAISMAKRITVSQEKLAHQRINHRKSMAANVVFCTACYYESSMAVKHFLEERGVFELFRKGYLNRVLDVTRFTMHGFRDSYARLIKQQLKLRNYETLGLIDAAEDDYEIKDYYCEMVEILGEKTETYEEPPFVSVVMPIYNLEPYLRTSLDGVIFQTLENIEIICVDDGSIDASVDIIKEYMARDNRIKLIQQENKGAGAARNKGFERANGKYTIFLDGDDIFDCELLEKTVERAEETDAEITAFNFTQTDAQGVFSHRTGIHTDFFDNEISVFNYMDCPDRIMTVVNPTPWNKLYRTDFIRNNNLKFEEISSSNDITFAAVSVATAERVTYIKNELLHYRRGLPNSITHGKAKKIDNVRIAVTSAIEQVKKLSYSDEIRDAMAYFAVDNIVYALQNNVDDIYSDSASSFYKFAHNFFQDELFNGVCEESIRRFELYAAFRVIKEVDYEQLIKTYKVERIVSLTSYPARIIYVAEAVKTIADQTVKADRIILWLAKEQFPNREKELPVELMELVDSGMLEIEWCEEDLKPHKKYFYAMQKYPEAAIITIDDDIIYPENIISNLFVGYLLYPKSVSAARTNLMVFAPNKNLLPYSEWIREYDGVTLIPSRQLIATGASGILYPPGLFNNEIFNKKVIRATCLFADDLWLKAIECLSNVSVVCVEKIRSLKYVPNSQEISLWKTNVNLNKNDSQINKIIRWIDSRYGQNFINEYIFNDPVFIPFAETVYLKNQKLNKLNSDLISKLYNVEKKLNIIQEQLNCLPDLTIKTSPIGFGITKGISIASLYDQMPHKSCIICDAKEINELSLPSKYGIVEIVKFNSQRGYVNFYSKEEGGDARMFIKPDGSLTGEWIINSALKSNIIYKNQ